MTHGLTINVNNDPLRRSISGSGSASAQSTAGSAGASGGVEQKFTNLNSVPDNKQATVPIVVNIFHFWSHNSNLPAQVPPQSVVAALPNLPDAKEPSCWQKYFCCCK